MKEVLFEPELICEIFAYFYLNWNPFQIVCLCNIPIKARNCVILILVFLGSCLGDSYSLYHYLGFRSQFQVAKASGV